MDDEPEEPRADLEDLDFERVAGRCAVDVDRPGRTCVAGTPNCAKNAVGLIVPVAPDCDNVSMRTVSPDRIVKTVVESIGKPPQTTFSGPEDTK